MPILWPAVATGKLGETPFENHHLLVLVGGVPALARELVAAVRLTIAAQLRATGPLYTNIQFLICHGGRRRHTNARRASARQLQPPC